MVYEPYWAALKKLIRPFNQSDLWLKTAKTLGLSKPAQERLSWIVFYHTRAQGNAKLTCRHFALNRSRFYYWLKRFDDTNLETLENRPSVPLTTRLRQITPEQEQRAIALRQQHSHWGKMKLVCLYQQTYGQKLSSWQFQRVIQRFKLYPKPVKNLKTQAKRLKAAHKKRITELKVRLPRLGWLLHFDTIVIYWNGLKRYLITMIDDFTKLAFARMYGSKSSLAAQDFLLRVNYLLTDRLQNVHQDNGSEFKRYFQELCQKLGLKQYYSRPRTPKDNPSLERFNQTLQYEWLRDGNFTPDINQFNTRLKDFIIEYNFTRPHETLNYLTPIQFAVKYKQVSERYPSDTVT